MKILKPEVLQYLLDPKGENLLHDEYAEVLNVVTRDEDSLRLVI